MCKSLVAGRDSSRLPGTLRTRSLKRHPMELGSDVSWMDRKSSITTFRSRAIIEYGMLCSLGFNHSIIAMPSSSFRSPLLHPCALPETSAPELTLKDPKKHEDWDSLTASFAGSANVPFLLLQLPQIVLNARNLIAGNNTALFAVPWLGMLTGLLGNLSLMSYFARKRETEAVVVQSLGCISTYVVIAQLAIAEAMPLPQFIATTAVVATGLTLNFLNYIRWLPEGAWLLWEDFMTIGGLAVLPQVMWSTFVPFIPNSVLPGIIFGSLATVAVVMLLLSGETPLPMATAHP